MSKQRDDSGAASRRPQRAECNGAAVTVTVLDAGLEIAGPEGTRLLDWLDLDGVVEGEHQVRLELADGTWSTLSKLGAAHDHFVAELREQRRRARFAALTIATDKPLVSYLSRAAAGLVDVHLYPKVLVAEPRIGYPVAAPLPLIERVERHGYDLTVVLRHLPSLAISALGVKTDEFLQRLAAARQDLQTTTSAAYAQYDEALTGLSAPDGWALTAETAGPYWSGLLARATSGSRAAEVQFLVERAGTDVAVGLYTDGGTRTVLPFVLAPVGDCVVVEATDGDDRATFVFRTHDVARLNAVLLLTAFRREALFLPDDQLGRWAIAARLWPAVREARAALVGRVVHDDNWQTRLSSVLGA